MRKFIGLFFSHLLFHFLIKNLNCEINRSLHNYQKDDIDTISGYSNSSNFINGEDSYIIDLNLANKNKRLKNNYIKLLNNSLHNYDNNNKIKFVLGKNPNDNEHVKLYEKNNSVESENGDISSNFMLINKHNTINYTTKNNGKKHELCNEEMKSDKCTGINKQNVDKGVFVDKNNDKILNNAQEQNQQFPVEKITHTNNNLKEKKGDITTESNKHLSNNTYMGDKISHNNLKKKKKKRKEKSILLQENYAKNGKSKLHILKDEGKNINLHFLDNTYNHYTDKEYFEKEKYIKIDYPIHDKAKQGRDFKNDNSLISDKKDLDNVPKNNNINFIKYNDKKYNDSKGEVLDESEALDDSDLWKIIEEGYETDNNSCPKKEDNNNKTKEVIDSNEPYKDFDLEDSLDENNITEDELPPKDIGKNKHDNANTRDRTNSIERHLSLKYLGLGYDIIMGNPEGDPTLNIDPGFRGPVLQINLEDLNFGDQNRNMKKANPWVIPEHSCSQSKNVEEIRNLEQYKLELASDVKISTSPIFPYSFSASLEFKNILHKLKVQNNVIFMMKIYCLRYYTGIPSTTVWTFTDNFKKALRNLPPTFEGLKEDSLCSYEDYANQINTPECEKNVNKWIIFFKLHGTHIAHEIYLGGKIILKMSTDKNQYNKMKENHLSMKPFFNFYFNKMGLSTSFSKQTQRILAKFNITKNVSILGGNPGLDVENSSFFERWVNSIGNNSMPIRTKLLPFSFFMKDPQMIQAYRDALTFYGLSYGVRIIDQEKYNNHVLSIGKYLEKCTQILYAGTPPGLLTCPLGSSILMGFSINLDFYKNKKLSDTIGMSTCEQMKESCSSNGFSNKYADTRIWALCSNNPIEFITQVVEQGESPKVTATCPSGLVILFGFSLMKGKGASSANNVDIYSCRTGQTSCSAIQQNSKYKQSMIYIACVDRTTKGLEHIQTFSEIKNMGYVVPSNTKNDGSLKFSCPNKGTLVFGFSIEFHTNFATTRDNFLYCSKLNNTCEIRGIGINTRLSFFRSDKHSLATIAVCRFRNEVKIT